MSLNGEHIKQLRTTMGWSQQDMASHVGVSLSTVHRWEQNTCCPSRLATKELERLMRRTAKK